MRGLFYLHQRHFNRYGIAHPMRYTFTQVVISIARTYDLKTLDLNTLANTK